MPSMDHHHDDDRTYEDSCASDDTIPEEDECISDDDCPMSEDTDECEMEDDMEDEHCWHDLGEIYDDLKATLEDGGFGCNITPERFAAFVNRYSKSDDTLCVCCDDPEKYFYIETECCDEDDDCCDSACEM